MVDISEKLKASLRQVKGVKKITYSFPKSWAVLPMLTYYEASNAPSRFADDKEYVSEIIYEIDIWAERFETGKKIALSMDGILSGNGFQRQFMMDLPDSSPVKHITTRYRYIGG